MRFIVLSLALLIIGIEISGQIIRQFEAIKDSLTKQLITYPQEKLHLHTDRTMYMPGEKIWFKAYLVDAFSHQPLTHSLYIYVELIDSTQTIQKRVMIRQDNNSLYHGYLPVPEKIAGGAYTIRAYTRYMENLGDDYFFKKNITVSGNEGSMGMERKPKDDYHVSLLPEGGHLLTGVFCKVAFKAQNVNGYSEAIAGEVVDEKGVQICTVKTVYAGMGYFVLLPEKNKKYYLKCKNSKGLEKRFELPTAVSVCAVFASFRNNNHLISIGKASDSPEKPLYMLIQSRGRPLYFDRLDSQKTYVSISREELPSGIIQFLLFDENLNPLSERLVYNKSDDQAEVMFNTDKPVYSKRELVRAELAIRDAEGAILQGNLSMAVTDDKDTDVDSMTTIQSSLLLSSELKGYIENPAYYLLDTPESERALDLLMMTHGWRRYNIPATIKGKYEYPKIAFEESKGITGAITSRILKKPVEGSKVTFFADDGTYAVLETDAQGRIEIFGLDYPENTRIIIQAKNLSDKNFVNLDIEKEQFPNAVYAFQIKSAYTSETSNKADEFLQKAAQRAKYDEDIRNIELGEIVVSANKPTDKVLNYYLNVKPDYTINREQIEQYKEKNVEKLIMRLPGVLGAKNQGVLSLKLTLATGNPVVIIDGVLQNWIGNRHPVENIKSVDDIKEIFVVGGGKTNRFGLGSNSRTRQMVGDIVSDWDLRGPSSIGGLEYWGDNGAIIINTFEGYAYVYTHRRHFNNVSLRPLGYQNPTVFYSPKYDTPEAKDFGVPDYRTTIFWKPDITVPESGKAFVDFYTADFSTTCSIVVEGLSSTGKIVRYVSKIEVK